MCIIDINNNCNVYVFCVMDARWDDFGVGKVLTNLCISGVFLSNQNLIILYYSNFDSFL